MIENFIHCPSKRFPHQQYVLMHKIPADLVTPIAKHGILIAGGAITSVFTGAPIKDLDLYPISYERYKEFDKILENLVKESDDPGDKLLFESKNAKTYKYKGVMIQVIHKFVKDSSSTVFAPEDILNTFDFTCCMGCYDLNLHEFVIHNKFLVDLAGRNLVYNSENPKYPICAMYRILKYEKKGFTISAGELVKLALCIAKLEMNTYVDLKEQLLGIDTLIFEEITTDLIAKNGKDAKIDYGVVMDTINEKLNSLWNSEQYQELIDNSDGDESISELPPF